MNEWSRVKLAWTSVFLCLCLAHFARADHDHGRYIPDEAFLGNIENAIDWGSAAAIEFTEDVICEECGGKIGEIRFSYDTWTGNYTGPGASPGGDLAGGGALAGGFWATEDCPLQEDWQFGWVQIVRGTIAGGNVWGAADGDWFPDTANKVDPDYPFETIPVGLHTPPNPGPTIGFQDFPQRFPVEGDQFWQAELGLVCKNLEDNEMKVLSSFLWGFNVEDNPAGIEAVPPGFWTVATPTYIETLEEHFDGTNGSEDWSVERGCCCCIPEPMSLTLAGIGLIGLFHFRGRADTVANAALAA